MSSPLKGFLVALSYGVTSITITFFNKAVLSYYSYPYSNVLSLSQLLFSLISVVALKKTGVVSYPDFQWSVAKKVLPLVVLFLSMVVLGLASLSLVNIPMFNALRRNTTLVVIVGEYLVLGKTTPSREVITVVFMVLGAAIAGWADMTSDLLGYILALASVLVTAGYLIFIKKTSNDTQLNTFGLIFYNNLLALPMQIIIVWWLEWDGVQTYDGYSNGGFQFSFFMSTIQGFLLNYLIFLCSTVNSPLTTSITGQMKNLFTTIIGLFLFVMLL